MSKLQVVGNRSFRMRRGKLVEIPPEWAGRTVFKQTIRKRKSKHKGGKGNNTRR